MTQHRRSLAVLAKAALVAAAAAGILYLAARPDGYAADKSDPPKATADPIDFVPADSVAVVSIRIADLWNHPALKTVLEKQGKDFPPLQKFSRSFGVGPEEIDRVTLIAPPIGPGSDVLVAVTTLKSYDQKAILAAAAPNAKEVKVKDHSFFQSDQNERGTSIAFLNDRTFVVGSSAFLEPFLSRSEVAKDGPMAPVLKLAAEKHLVVAGLNIPMLAKSQPPADKLPPDFKPFTPLFKAQLATLTVDLDDQLRADVRLTFATAADAKEGTAAFDAALDLFRHQFADGADRFSKLVNSPKLTALLEDFQAALKAAKAEQKGATVGAEAELKIDPDAITAALTEAVPKIKEAAKRMEISNDLKQLGIAVQAYNDSNGHMLPPAVYDKNGKALLSWRVLLLPYIGEGNLYNGEFHLDEPWDSDHNKKLLAKMPTTFAPPDSQAFKDHESVFQAIVGKGTAFEKPGLSFPAAFTDGTSNIILFVEAKKGVPWTKPEDISLDDGKLLPKLGGLTEGGFMTALCDGSVRFFPLTVKEDALRTWATRNNGQVRPDPDK